MLDNTITLWSTEGDQHATFHVVAVPHKVNVHYEAFFLPKNIKKETLDYKISTPKYEPNKHCGVLNSTGNPCMNSIICRTHKVHEKMQVFRHGKELPTLIKEHKIAMASALVKPSKNSYNPNIHCGVKGLKGYPCMRNVICNIHTIVEKRTVIERSEKIEDLIKKHKMAKSKKAPKSIVPLYVVRRIKMPLKNVYIKDEQNSTAAAQHNISKYLGEYVLVTP